MANIAMHQLPIQGNFMNSNIIMILLTLLQIYEHEVKSNRFAYCQLLVVPDPNGPSCLLHREVPVKHMVTEDDQYAVYIVYSSSGER